MSTSARRGPTGLAFTNIEHSADFLELRNRFRRFTFPLTAIFLTWYFLYVALAAYAPAFMSIKVFGNVNIGLLLGLGQFASTFLITWLYTRWADQKFDATAERLRGHLEEGL